MLIDFARAGAAAAGDGGRGAGNGDVDAGVPEAEDPAPLKREIGGVAVDGAPGEEDVVAVAETADIWGAAPWEGTRCRRREVIWCASGWLWPVQSRVLAGDAARDEGLEFVALAALADERPEEPARERFGEAEPLASVHPSSASSASALPRSKCTLLRWDFCTLVWLALRRMPPAVPRVLRTSVCDLFRLRFACDPVFGSVSTETSRLSFGSEPTRLTGLRAGLVGGRGRSEGAWALSLERARVLGTRVCRRWVTGCLVLTLCSLWGGGVLERVLSELSWVRRWEEEEVAPLGRLVWDCESEGMLGVRGEVRRVRWWCRCGVVCGQICAG